MMDLDSFDARWYRCLIEDRFGVTEPDWSRVPAGKRETVRQQFLARSAVPPESWLLWGPQIPWYQRQPMYRITVVEGV